MDGAVGGGSDTRISIPFTVDSTPGTAQKKAAENQAPEVRQFGSRRLMSIIFGPSSFFASSSGDAGKSAEEAEAESSSGASEAASCSSKPNESTTKTVGVLPRGTCSVTGRGEYTEDEVSIDKSANISGGT